MDLATLLIIGVLGALTCTAWRLGDALGEMSATLRDWMDNDKEQEEEWD